MHVDLPYSPTHLIIPGYHYNHYHSAAPANQLTSLCYCWTLSVGVLGASRCASSTTLCKAFARTGLCSVVSYPRPLLQLPQQPLLLPYTTLHCPTLPYPASDQ
eukprot:3846944-Rhodomonas_salina.1